MLNPSVLSLSEHSFSPLRSIIHAGPAPKVSSRCESSVLFSEGTPGGIEIPALGPLAHCRILDGHHKVLQKLRVCPHLHHQSWLEAEASIGFCVCISGT